METGKGADIREVLQLHRFVYKSEPSLRSTSGQAASAAGSIGANLEEADAAQSRADFVSKCNIALKEARESRYWLRVLSRFVRSDRIGALIAECTEIIAILTTIVKKSRDQ